MQRCNKHSREVVATCNWCGDKLCGHCTIERTGHLCYCADCSASLKIKSAQAPTPTLR